MGKRPSVSVRIDEETKDRLDSRDDLNLSGLMRGMLEDYLRVGDSVEVALEKRRQEKEEELKELEIRKTELENQIAQTERELDDIQSKIDERRNSVPEEVVEFAEKIKSGQFRHEQLDPDNPALQNWSQKAGLSPNQFIRKVEDRL